MINLNNFINKQIDDLVFEYCIYDLYFASAGCQYCRL